MQMRLAMAVKRGKKSLEGTGPVVHVDNKGSDTPGKVTFPMTTIERGGGTIITLSSSLIPNDTFRYQVKFLALSKAQMKVLRLPCPLLGPRRGQCSSNSSSKFRASLLWGLVYSRTLPRRPRWFQRSGTKPPDNLEGS